MGLLAESVLTDDGDCAGCQTTDVDTKATLQCDSCKNTYHMLCDNVDEEEKQCTKTFLVHFYNRSTKKPNFSWKCDPCTIEKDNAEKTSLSLVVNRLAIQVDALTTKFDDFKHDITAIQSTAPQPNAQGNPWTNPRAVRELKSSFLVKPSGSTKADIEKINKIVIDNNLQVNKIGVSLTGNTFVHCPTEEASNSLQERLQTELDGHIIQPLQDPHPSISIAGVTKLEWNPSHVTPEGTTAFLERLRNQNPFLDGLIANGESFNILFMKPPSDNYDNFQIVARVSPQIRDAINAHSNRLFISSTSVRVYDRFYIKRCNRCNKFGHYMDKCRESSPSCGICSAEDHESENCSHKADTSRHRCINCKRASQPHTGHNATSRKCPAYMTAQKKLKGNTPYYQGARNVRPPSRY